ncbi:hypothetical protein D3C78_1331830 [compost metagenome]
MLTALEKLVDEYKASGELKGALAQQLNNSLKQAVHHQEKGSLKNAMQAMEKFLNQLEKPAKKDDLSARAKLNLSRHAQLIIEMWK